MMGISVFAFAFLLGSAEAVEVTTLQRETLVGELLELGASRMALRVQDARREIENQEVLQLRWVGRQRERKPVSALAELWNGDTLRGSFQALSTDRFAIRQGSGTAFEIRLDSLRRLAFPRAAGTEDLSSFSSAEGKDRLYPRKTGSAFDFSNGTMEGFDGDRVAFRTARGSVEKFELSEVAALALAPLEAPAPEKDLLALVEFVDGSRLTGKIAGLRGGKIEIESALLGSCVAELRDLFSVRFKNARFRYLSDLDPVRVEEATPFGSDEPVLFPYQKDRSVGGKPLRVGGAEYSRGLGVHSRCVLVYRLNKSFRVFRAAVGIDDEVLELPAKGSVVFRVRSDGKLLYESPIVRGGAGAISLPDLDVSGAEELTLEVDYADDWHVADRADWLEPLLIP